MTTQVPFRFKAGSNMSATEPFHHRRSSQNTHKPFKSKHATKSLLRELSKGKIENKYTKGTRKTPHQQVMSKFDRKNHAKQIRKIKQEQNERMTSVFAGANGAPRIVAIIPLSSDVNLSGVVEKLMEAADADVDWPLGTHIRARVERFKQSLMFIPANPDLLDVTDVAKVADFVVFVFSSTEEPDERAELFLRAVEGQGVSNAITVVQSLDSIDNVKKRAQWTFGLKTWVTRYLPHQEKVLSLDSTSECANAIRSLCTTTPKGVRWRESRSWMLVEDVRWPDEAANQDTDNVEVVVSGVVRGKGLKADRLVQLSDFGHFQIKKITSAPLPTARKRKAVEMTTEDDSTEDVLQIPGAKHDDLDELAPYEASMDDVDDLAASEAPSQRRGVLLDDHHYLSEGEDEVASIPKRVPKGTSKYQAAWYLGNESDSGSEYEDMDDDADVEMDSPALPPDGIEGMAKSADVEPNEGASEYPASEMFLDPSPAQEAAEIEEYRQSRKDEAKEDLEFPDEIELHPNVLARERLAKYRGLKSLRTSPWKTSQDRFYEPEDWQRLLGISDYKRTRKQVENDALVGGVPPGTRVNVHLRSVPISLRESLTTKKPLALYSLLKHEHKRSVVNVSITLSSSHPKPIRSKEELIIQIGPRRFRIKPLFSNGGATPNDVHKFLRYLHPGQSATASFMAPITWGSVPILFFQPSADSSSPDSLNLIATGTTLAPSTTRIIAKRVCLTGHPFKINRNITTVRYMFFNTEDVLWFKALQLWTKRGRSGFIKESLGTHGYFKATFDAKINPMDAVGVSLYKRVWPRLAVPFRAGMERGGVEDEEGAQKMEVEV